jgi:2-oxoglutarate/2-oxoacid ferredoxin oxidoreductase subunit beta
VDIKHLTYVLERAAHHKGTALVEVYQDCNVFNHDAFLYASDKSIKQDNIVYLEHGKPLVFGKDRKKGIRLNAAMEVEAVELGDKVHEDDLVFHDEKAHNPSVAFMLSRMKYPHMPEPMGVFRAIERPLYDQGVNDQLTAAVAKQGEGDFDALFNSGDTWTVD